MFGAVALVAPLPSTGSRLQWLADFKGDFYAAGRSIIHGQNPYARASHLLAHLSATGRPGGVSATLITPTKPAPVLVLGVPFASLPADAVGVVFVLGLVAALFASLRLLGVRDWRCHVVALCAWPTVAGLYVGNMSPLMLFAAAVLWRTRQRLLLPALSTAVLLLIKLFPWPIAAWLVITRRFRQLALSVAIGVVALVVGWAIIGFAGLASYPTMLSHLDHVLGGSGSSFTAALISIGAPAPSTLALAAGLLLLLLSRRLARDGDEARSFAVAVIAALIATPHAWDHYYVLLFAPIALVQPRLSPLWLAPAIIWPVAGWEPGLSVLAETLVLAAVLRRPLTVSRRLPRLRRAFSAPAEQVDARTS